MGKIIFWVLPGRPETSRYLTTSQRTVAIARAKRGLHPEPPSTIDTHAVKPAFHDIRIYIYALLYTAILMPNLSLFYFLPSVIADCGWGQMPKNALMTVPPLASSFIGMILVAWKSDRMRDRGRWIALLTLIGAVGYVLLLTVPVPGLRYFAVFLVSWGSLYFFPGYDSLNDSPALPLTLAWISGNCATETKRSLGLSVAVSMGNTIPIALPWAFSLTAAPRFFVGYAVCTGLLVFACVLSLVLHWYCLWENGKMDREYGNSSGKVRVDGDDDVNFRYFY